MLDGEPDLEVVGEAASGREAVELCRSLRPKLVLMDVRMPEMDGLAATRMIKEEFPITSVLIVTTYDDPDYLLEAIEAGAAGFVLKDARKRKLIEAVRSVLNSEATLNSELAMQLIKRFASETTERRRKPPPAPGKPNGAPSARLEELTPRELEVLPLLVQGKSNPEIAKELVITRATAKVHVRHIINKFGVSDRTQAVVRALELGFEVPETGR
jgi:DNA-binding NarL/FixJ family response regulator